MLLILSVVSLCMWHVGVCVAHSVAVSSVSRVLQCLLQDAIGLIMPTLPKCENAMIIQRTLVLDDACR